jgi:hypothetical protein
MYCYLEQLLSHHHISYDHDVSLSLSTGFT